MLSDKGFDGMMVFHFLSSINITISPGQFQNNFPTICSTKRFTDTNAVCSSANSTTVVSVTSAPDSDEECLDDLFSFP